MTTPTQGEHAQTEALRLADALYDGSYLLSVERYTTANELRRLHARNEALIGGLKKANEQAEHFEREWYLRGDEIEALHAQVAALTAQPAAPQGVAYAELPEFEELDDELIDLACSTGALYRVDFKRAWEVMREGLRASHGQAPAGATDPDGEAFRTAARQGLTLRFYGGCAQSSMPGTPSAYEVVADNDRAVAMREAVRRAAAVIANGGEPQRLDSPTAQAAPAAERQYIYGVKTVADLVNNLLLLDQSLPIYAAQHIQIANRRRTITVPPTVSRERVKDERWIGEGDELNAAVIWTRAEQPAQAPAAGAVAGPGDEGLIALVRTFLVREDECRERENDDGDRFTDLERTQYRILRASAVQALRKALAAAPTPAAPTDSMLEDAALSTDDAALLEKAIADFEECGETDVPDADLRRFAAAGYLECVHYHVMPAAQEAIDAARKQGGTHDNH